ncbi:MAG: Hpt domain-containing protein [Beijerinckiaceae bacterium]
MSALSKTFAARCAFQATALLACGAAGGHLLALLAPDDWRATGFIAGGLFALALLATFAALTSRRPGARRPLGPAVEEPRIAHLLAPEPVRRLRPDDVLIPIEGAIIDDDALEALRQLGGEAFVTEVVSQFISEGVLTLLKVAQAIGQADATEYAAQVHALRSSAANVGARRLYKLCLEWRELSADEIARSGSARFVLLQKEFSAAEAALKGRAAPTDSALANLAKAG